MVAAGDSIGRYRIVKEIGRGGMGVVYAAEDQALRREVAVKVVTFGRGEQKESPAVTRLLREARIAAQLSHPNIVAVYDVGVEDGRAFIAMERIDGTLLTEYIGDRTVGLSAKLRWLGQIADALASAHAKGLVHRDIKPDNVMITRDGQAKVLDFGIAGRSRLLEGAAGEGFGGDSLTLNAGAGTPAYMSPEQLLGVGVGEPSDQFSWGVLAFRLLSGSLPWRAKDTLSIVAELVQETAPPLADAMPDVPETVAALVDRALARDPTERWPSMKAVAAHLDRRTSPESETRPDPASDPEPPEATLPAPPRAGTRSWVPWLIAGAVVIGVGSWAMIGREDAATPPSPPLASSEPAVVRSMLDLPEPVCREAALVRYKDGIRSTRDGNYEQAFLFFQESVDLDPNCGAAWMRLFRTGRGRLTPERLREAFRVAQNYRDQLTERDKELLTAYEPLIAHEPPDRDGFGKRFGEVARKHPDDAELQAGAAFFATQLDFEERMAFARRSVEADPGHADGHQAIAWLHAQVDDVAKARTAAAQCVDHVPAATDCIKMRLVLDAELGDCASMEKAARQWIARSPNTSRGYQMLAQALAAQGQPRATVEEVLQQRWARLPDVEKLGTRLTEAAAAAAYYGDFETAAERLTEAQEAIADSTYRELRSRAALMEIELALEQGDHDRVRQAGRAFLEREGVWTATMTSDADSDGFFHAVPRVIEILRPLDPKLEVAERIEAWRVREGGANVINSWGIWALGDALLASNADEAKGAVARVPGPLPSAGGQVHVFRLAGRTGISAAATGRALALAGQIDDAIAYLEAGARSCAVLTDPFGAMRARLWLAEAQLRAGAADEACAAIEPVAQRWGTADPAPLTGIRATALRAKCPTAVD